MPYRPSIDGMRALAVLSVLLFHLKESLLPGGFVGVDVFFVISGYLITSIIYGESEAGNFSLMRFYQRRMARIFPVFFAVTLAIILAAAWLYTAQDYAIAGAYTTASALSLTNIKFLLEGNYFEASADARPFLHYWSLAVEEQFYMFLPFFLIACKRFNMSRKSLLILLWVMTIVSFIAGAVVTYINASAAFYLLPTRAWELFAGSILAISLYQSKDSSPENPDWKSNTLSMVGLCMVMVSFFLISESLPFPGYIAILPVLGTVLLIGQYHDSGRITDRMLSWAPVVFIGKLSYSLYLWHWPIYCFVDYACFENSELFRTSLKLTLTVTCSLISYYWIERPTRRFLNNPDRRSLVYTGFVVGVLAFAVAGFWIRNDRYLNSSLKTAATGGIQFDAGTDAPAIVLMGESQGSMYGTMLRSLCADAGYSLNIISVAADDPLPDRKLYHESIKFLTSRKPDITILACAWRARLKEDTERLTIALDEIQRHSSSIILFDQPPIVPESGTREGIRQLGPHEVFEDAESKQPRERANAFVVQQASDRIRVLNVASNFVDDNGAIRIYDDSRVLNYQDKTHLSENGAEKIQSELSELIRQLLRESR